MRWRIQLSGFWSNTTHTYPSENSLRRTTIQTLQSEVEALQLELLQVRQTNLALNSQVTRLRQEQTHHHSEVSVVLSPSLISL